MERIEYFSQELELRAQRERDAKVLVKVPGKLLIEAEKIVDEVVKKQRRSVGDFV